MNEAVLAKHSLALAVSAVNVTQAVAPAALAVVNLYGVIAAYDVTLTPPYHVLAIVVALLALLLMGSAKPIGAEDPGGSFPVSIALLVRWSAT